MTDQLKELAKELVESFLEIAREERELTTEALFNHLAYGTGPDEPAKRLAELRAKMIVKVFATLKKARGQTRRTIIDRDGKWYLNEDGKEREIWRNTPKALTFVGGDLEEWT